MGKNPTPHGYPVLACHLLRGKNRRLLWTVTLAVLGLCPLGRNRCRMWTLRTSEESPAHGSWVGGAAAGSVTLAEPRPLAHPQAAWANPEPPVSGPAVPPVQRALTGHKLRRAGTSSAVFNLVSPGPRIVPAHSRPSVNTC